MSDDPVPAAALRLAQISERLEKISGPWRSMRDGNQYIKTRYLPTAKLVAASRIDGLVRPWNPHAYVAFGFKPEEFETSRFVDADADFIAEAPSDVTYLLAVLARAEQTIREQQEKDLARVELPVDCVATAGSTAEQPPGAVTAAERTEKVFVSGTSSEWWVCFHCWRAFYVPTTGYFGNCDGCGKPTQRWPADPNVTLSMLEWQRPVSSRSRPATGAPETVSWQAGLIDDCTNCHARMGAMWWDPTGNVGPFCPSCLNLIRGLK